MISVTPSLVACGMKEVVESSTSVQDLMRAKLGQVAIPKKDIAVYGSQIVITCMSLDAATRWRRVLTHFARVRGVARTTDESKLNRGTCLQPTRHTVYKVFATVR